MDAKREIEAVALDNLERQREEIDRRIQEIKDNRDKPVQAESVIGRFDGVSMIGEDGRTYPVPANYVSKSALLEGDMLRLYLSTMLFKQIEHVTRKTIFATYVGSNRVQDASGTLYDTVHASVSFFGLEIGDEVLCDIPEATGAKYAAIRGITKKYEH